MGTVVTFDIRAPAVPGGVIDAATAWLHEVEAVFSTFLDDSEVCRLDRGDLTEAGCRPEVREVLGLCREVERASGGCFDLYAGGRLDPSGLVKGWSVQRAAAMLRAAGARNFFVSAGGDLVTSGHAAPGESWRIGIRHPAIPDHMAAVLAVTDLAIATSGAYERGPHIVDPRTGRPATGLLSMTVAGPSLTYSDAYATAAFVMGEAGLGWVAEQPGYDALAITVDHRTVWTAGLDAVLLPAAV